MFNKNNLVLFFEGDNEGSLKVRTLKTALAVLCSGKLMDKLRYIFSLLADNHGHLIHEKYASFVQDVTCVPQGKFIIITCHDFEILSIEAINNCLNLVCSLFLKLLVNKFQEAHPLHPRHLKRAPG